MDASSYRLLEITLEKFWRL